MQVSSAVVSVLLLLPTASWAQGEIGVGVGYSGAFGDVARGSTRDASMGALALRSQIPVQVEAAYAIEDRIAVGAYLSYGFGQTDELLFSSVEGQLVCGRGSVSCSGTSLRFGIQGTYILGRAHDVFEPWIALALGVERIETDVAGPGGRGSTRFTGGEVGVRAGADWQVASGMSLGVFFQASIGQYYSGEISLNGVTMVGGGIESKAFHEWVGAGIRGKLRI